MNIQETQQNSNAVKGAISAPIEDTNSRRTSVLKDILKDSNLPVNLDVASPIKSSVTPGGKSSRLKLCEQSKTYNPLKYTQKAQELRSNLEEDNWKKVENMLVGSKGSGSGDKVQVSSGPLDFKRALSADPISSGGDAGTLADLKVIGRPHISRFHTASDVPGATVYACEQQVFKRGVFSANLESFQESSAEEMQGSFSFDKRKNEM